MDIRYTAGLFDAEGGIAITKTRQRVSANLHYTLKVYMQMTHFPTVKQLADLWGGSTNVYRQPSRKENWKDQLVWVICAIKARNFLLAIQPYCVIKQEQIKVALEFQNLIQEKGYNKKLSAEQMVQREDCFMRLKLLNKRGR